MKSPAGAKSDKIITPLDPSDDVLRCSQNEVSHMDSAFIQRWSMELYKSAEAHPLLEAEPSKQVI